MNRVLAIVLMLSLCCQSMVKLGIVAWYQVNKNYIAANFCINKSKPELKCCGKCYLRKQLNKVDNSNNTDKHRPRKSDKTESFDCIIASTMSLSFDYPPANIKHIQSYTNRYMFRYAADVFHPPPPVV